MEQKGKKKIVTIGGGTGTSMTLSGLKKYPQNLIDITAIVTMMDSGGSTGRLRDEFGYLPVGDVRMALAALSNTKEREILRELFLYRFNKGEGLSGHNFGNLFLVALTDILGSEEEAIEYAGKILNISGKVLPVTVGKADLVAGYENGEITYGETNIDEVSSFSDGKQRIKKLFLEPEVQTTDKVRQAIEETDFVILGPGDLYTSIIPNIIVGGVAESLKNTKGKIIYIVNLMTKWGQTYGFTAKDHIDEIIKYTDRVPDYIFMNNTPLPLEILEIYANDNEIPVEDNLQETGDYNIVRGDFVNSMMVEKSSSDKLKRSLIRHDSDKLAKAIMNLLEE